MPRKDLNKVICERGRSGAGTVKGRHKMEKIKKGVAAWPYKGESTSPHPHKEGIQKPYINQRKGFNEHLNPLWGLLRKSVGSRWDSVYSDISKLFDKRKVINQHILIHLFQNVEIHTFMKDGKVHFTAERSGEVQPIMESAADYYVHPISGILFANKRISWRTIKKQSDSQHKKKEAEYLRLLGKFNNKDGPGSRYAISIKDIWYEISVVKRPEATKHRRLNSKGETEYFIRFPQVDAVSIFGAQVLPPELRGHTQFYVCRKEQLNKKRIRDLGLN